MKNSTVIARLAVTVIVSLGVTKARADTVRSLPDVMYQLRDAQAAGSITPQVIRDALKSVAPQTTTPLAYGAVCDGNHHSISSTLGLSTLTAVKAYTTPSGATPYAWLGNAGWTSVQVALRLTAPAGSGATVLYVPSVLGVPVGATVSGSGIPANDTISSVSNPSTISTTMTAAYGTAGTTTLALASATGIVVGSRPVPQAGLSQDDWVTAVSGNNVTLKFGTTAALASGATVIFQPPSSITLAAATTAAKPSVESAASTTAANYFIYLSWPMTDAMIAAAEMDWLGTQSAIEAATSAGGVVLLPPTSCIMDNTTVAGNAAGGLVVHETGQIGGIPSVSVNLSGSGVAPSTLIWPSEMGAGRAALSFGAPYATWDNGVGRYGTNYYGGILRDVTLVGPMGRGATTVGVTGTRTVGIQAGARRTIDNVTSTGFYIGATFENVDHTMWKDVSLLANVMNLRVGAAGTILYGNDRIQHLELGGAALANISLDKNFFFNATDIDTLYCGFAPKCIRMEAGPLDSYGAPSGGGVWAETDVNNVNAEYLGVGFISDDNFGPNGIANQSAPTPGGGELTMREADFRHLDMTYSSTYLPSGSKMNFWIQVGNLYRSTFDFITGEPAPVAGMQAAVWFDQVNYGDGGDLFTGSMTSLLANYGATPFFAIYGAGFNNSFTSIKVCEPQSWCGHVESYYSPNAAVQGTPLDYYMNSITRVEPATGTAPFAGIMMSASGASNIYSLPVVATSFCYSGSGNAVGIPTSGTASATNWGKLAAGGTVTNAGGPTDGVVIGTIIGTGTNVAYMNIGRQGSCD